MRFRRRRSEEPEINLIPFIDVLLVILIFLMLSTTYSKFTELQINLPTADTEKQPERPNEVNVLVNAQGQLVVNHVPMPFTTREALAEALRKAAAAQKDPILVISADATATHQAVIRVMEAARLAGLSQITFTTQSAK